MAGLVQVNNSATSRTIDLDGANRSLMNINDLWRQHLQNNRQFAADDRTSQLQVRDDKTYADTQRDAAFRKDYANAMVALPDGTMAPAASVSTSGQVPGTAAVSDNLQTIKQAIPGSGRAAVYDNQLVPARPAIDNPQVAFTSLVKGSQVPNPMYTGERKPETSARMAKIAGIEDKYAPLLQTVNADKNPVSNIPGRTNPISQVMTPAKQNLLNQMEAEKDAVYAPYPKTIATADQRVNRTVGLGGIDMSQTYDSTGTKAAPDGDGSQAYFRTKTPGANGHVSMVPVSAVGTAQSQATPEMVNTRVKIQDAIPTAYENVMAGVKSPNKPLTTTKDANGDIVGTVSTQEAVQHMAGSFMDIAKHPVEGQTMEEQKKTAIKTMTAKFIDEHPGADASKLLPLANELWDSTHNTGKLSDSETAQMNAAVKDLEHRYSVDKDTTAYQRDLAKLNMEFSNRLTLQDRADDRLDKRQARSDDKTANTSIAAITKEMEAGKIKNSGLLIQERQALVNRLTGYKFQLMSKKDLSSSEASELRTLDAQIKSAKSGMPL
jgi:hypothetical protein